MYIRYFSKFSNAKVIDLTMIPIIKKYPEVSINSRLIDARKEEIVYDMDTKNDLIYRVFDIKPDKYDLVEIIYPDKLELKVNRQISSVIDTMRNLPGYITELTDRSGNFITHRVIFKKNTVGTI